MNVVVAFFSTIWKYWKAFGHAMGDFVGRIFLMLFYLTATLPFGLMVALFMDPLDIKGKKTPTYHERATPEASLENSYNQF
jgi:hypothetical protein